jgi:hypothetical protein
MTAEKYDSDNLLLFGLHLNRMVEGSRRDVSASSHKSLQRFRSASDVKNLDLTSGVLEKAWPLGDRQRSVLQECSPAYGHPDRSRLEFRLLRQDMLEWRLDERD